MKNLFTNLVKMVAKVSQNAKGEALRGISILSTSIMHSNTKTTRKRDVIDTYSDRNVSVTSTRLLRYAATVLLLLCLGVGNMWGMI